MGTTKLTPNRQEKDSEYAVDNALRVWNDIGRKWRTDCRPRLSSAKQFEQLENFVLANQREEPEFGQLMTVSVMRGYGKVIKAQNYVGVITLKDGTTIEILPKISSVSYDEEKTKGEMRKLLVRMLRSLRSVPYKSTQSSKIDAEKLPLFEIFVRMFLDEVFFIVRKGLKCGYETIRGNEKFYKGKMLFGT